MNQNHGHKRSTSRDIQRSLFSRSLREQLSKISDLQSGILKAAKEYLDQGMDIAETQELLLIDGHEKSLIIACMKNLAESGDEIQETGKQWGFNVEDSYGRIVSSAELGIVITAANEEEAWSRAEQAMEETESDRELDRVTDVYEL